jgi:hypothetical protein
MDSGLLASFGPGMTHSHSPSACRDVCDRSGLVPALCGVERVTGESEERFPDEALTAE